MAQAAILDKPQTASREKKTLFKKAILYPDAVKAERCRRSFYYFIQEFWDCVSADEFKTNWHIPYLCSELTGLAERVAKGLPKEHDLIINIPPGTTKSTICSIMFPVWCWTKWPWMRFIVASYSGALSLEHAEYSRDLIRSEKFKSLFPELNIKQDKDTKSNFRIIKRHPNGLIEIGGNRYSTSVGGTLTGFHAHILIVDDPLDPNRAVSEAELNSANRWIDQTLSTRKVDKAITPTVLIQQRLHQNDSTGHILNKKKKNIRHISLPGEIRNYKKYLKPQELAEFYTDDLFDPVRMPWPVMKELESDLGQYGYAGQIGQNPVPPGGGMFKVDHFQIIDQMPAPVNIIQTVRYWDNAGTQGAGAFSVGCKMHKLQNGKFLIPDVKRGQWASDERERIKKETAEADGSSCIVYSEQEPGSSGKDMANATIRNLAGFIAFADRPTGDKIYRADPYSVQVNNGNVLLLRGEWNHAFIEEHRNFPYSTYKDQVDGASGAFGKLAARKMVRSLLSGRR